MKEKRYTALMSDASAEASRQDERNPQEVKEERKQSRLAKAGALEKSTWPSLLK